MVRLNNAVRCAIEHSQFLKCDELEEKRNSYRKKLRKLGEELTELERYQNNKNKKSKLKEKAYEDTLANIDQDKYLSLLIGGQSL